MLIAPDHSLTIFYIPRAPTAVVPEMVKASWAAEKTGPAKWNGIRPKQHSCHVTGQKPQTPEALGGNSRGG